MVTTLSIHLLLLLKYKSIPISDYRHVMVTTLSKHLLLLLKYKSIPISYYRHAVHLNRHFSVTADIRICKM